jgi:hypothetical protein
LSHCFQQLRKIDARILDKCSVLNIMTLMSLEIVLLRTLLRSARRRTLMTVEDLAARVGGDPRLVCRALSSLARSELVHRTPQGPRLSLSGFAVAVAASAVRPAPRAKRLSGVAGVPLVRRRRAA